MEQLQQMLRQEEIYREISSLFEEYTKRTGKYHYALVHSFGCQQNVADGEKLRGMLARMGYRFTEEPREADLILFNTCAVRESAQDRVYGQVGALKKLKEENPSLIIALCGCMTQQQEVLRKLRISYPQVDLAFGTHQLAQFPQLLSRVLLEGGRVLEALQEDEAIAEGLPVERESSIKAWISIMYGCNNFCSYCIVPYVRGRERSRAPQQILQEIRELAAQGYREFTLLGQNVNSYGKDLEEPVSFAELLRRIEEIPGDFRLRFMTSHPKDCTRELIDVIAASSRICHHLHLPVQSGDDRILGEMNRRYTVDSYLDIIRYAREKIPDVSFTSDIIVGFPGEREEEFENTLRLIEQVQYQQLFTFIYSPRSGTKAAAMPDPVPYEEKSRWMRRLLALQTGIAEKLLHARIGQCVRVLVEEVGNRNEAHLIGRSDDNSLVVFAGSPELIGTFVTVRITGATDRYLSGEIVSA